MEVRVLPPELHGRWQTPLQPRLRGRPDRVPFVVLIGIVIGLLLRDTDDGPSEAIESVADGEIDGVAYRIDARPTWRGQLHLPVRGRRAENGACGHEPQDVTYGEQTVVFGLTDPSQTTAAVELSNGEVVEIATTKPTPSTIASTEVVDGDVNAVALTG